MRWHSSSVEPRSHRAIQATYASLSSDCLPKQGYPTFGIKANPEVGS